MKLWHAGVRLPTTETGQKGKDTTRFSGVEFQLRPNQSYSVSS